MEKSIVEEAIKKAGSMYGAAAELNLSKYKFNKLAKSLGLWNPNQSGKGLNKPRSFGKYDLNDILKGKHPQYPTNKLKKRLIFEGIKQNQCEICGVNEWMGKELVCQLDHINGNARDHVLENLRILCPNCHTQTDTFCGKNK